MNPYLRKFQAAFALALFSIWFTGCSGSKSNTIILRCADYSEGPAEMKIIAGLVADFEKDHPGVKIKEERVTWNDYIPKLLTQFAAGDAPDILQLDSAMLVDFYTRGALTDLKTYTAKDPSLKLNSFYPEVVRQYTVDGGLYAIPRDVQPIALIYYNKKKFDEAGLPYPKNDWDYLQFLKTAQKLTKKDAQGKIIQYGFADQWMMTETWIYTFGGTLLDNPRKPTRFVADSPQAIAGVNFRSDLVYKYGVSPNPSSLTSMSDTGNADLFMNGTVAMYHTGIWQVPTFQQIKDFDWDVVEFPKGPHNRRAFDMAASGYAIVKGSKHPDLAYELAKYFGGETGQKYMASAGLTQPAIIALGKSSVFLNGQKPVSKGFLVNAVKDGRFPPFDPNRQEWMIVLGSYLDRVWNGTEKPEVALKKAAKEINAKFFKGSK